MIKKYFFIWFVLHLFVLFSTNGYGQSRSATLGKQFYVAFGENANIGNISLKLKVSTTKTAIITVTYADGTSFSQSVSAYTTTDILLDNTKTYPSLSTSGDLLTGVIVQSTEEVSLYAINQANNSTEATAILPIESLGTSYKVLSYKASQSLGVLAVVPTANNTSITVTGNGTITNTVDVGEVHYDLSPYNDDVTAYAVSSDKPVAVFSLPAAVKIPNTQGDADNLFEQNWRTESWGKKYLVPITDRGKDRVRVIARENGTQITGIVGTGLTGMISSGVIVSPAFPISLNAGDWVEFEISNSVEIRTNKPTAVSSYMSGNKHTMTSGDPSQCWINPTEQMTAYSLMSPFYMPTSQSMITTHKLVIVTREKYKGNTTLKINNNPYTLTFINPPGMTDYAIATVTMNNANNYIYEIENLYGFNAYVYGYGSEESYFLASGANIWDLNAYFTIDTIHHKATSPATNTYSTSGTARIFRNIEYQYDNVRWLIRNDSGTCDISTYVNDATSSVEFSWSLPTDTGNVNLCLEMGENEIILIIKNTATGAYDTLIGKIWITPPPDPKPDYEIIFGNNGGGGSGGGSPCIPVLDNDDYVNQRDSVYISDGSSHGNATLTGIPTLCYTPDSAFTGLDTITYCVVNEYNDTVCEEVYILTVIPTADHYEACPGTIITIGLLPTPNVSFNWYDAPTGGTLLDSLVDTLDVLVTNRKTYYFEPIVNGSSFYAGKRVSIELYVSQLCGQSSEMACDGSILFEEDFRGNDTTDALFGNTPLYPYSQHNIPCKNYSLIQSTTLSAGQYALPKEIPGFADDHTFEGNNQRGRMLYIHTKALAPDTIIGINIGNLCEGLIYTFSAWIQNIDASNNPNLVFELANPVTGTVCSRFTTGDIHQNVSNQWLQYGFQYKASSDYQNLKLYIMNLTGETKILIDDIKVAICIDPVSINLLYDTICIDESTQFTAVLNEASIRDSLGVSRLGYLWQYNNGQDSIWTNVYYSNSVKTYSISKGQFLHKGYYRVVVGDYTTLSLTNSIHNPNCVVYSDQVYLHVKECFTLYDDYVITGKDSLVVVNILDNDIVPCSSSVVTVNTNPRHGTAFINGNNNLNYQPDNSFIGIDSLQYKVVCGSETKYAWVYIVTVGIKANQYSGCPGAEIVLGVESISNVTIKWYRQATAGVSLYTGTSYTLIMSNTDTVLYVEFTYQGVTLSERIPIYIVLSELCGDYTNKACEGNIVFTEDFKGNNPNDSSVGTALSLPVYSDYIFSASSYFSAGQYSICKNKANDPANSWAAITDHTYPNDTSSGNFMYVHTQNNLSMIYQNEIPISLCNKEENVYLSAWLRNFNAQLSASKPILRFVIEDTTGQILLDYLTGEISFDNQWKQYGKTFKIGINTTRIIIKLYNLNSSNSFIALDNIELRICTPSAINIASNSYTLCQNDNLVLSPTYNQTALNTIYGAGNVIFRWQKSSTGNINDNSSWITLSGRISDTLTFNSIHISDEGYYRLIAGNTSTINNPACRTASDAMRVLVNPLPIVSHSGITAMCIGDTTQLSVTGGSTYSWLHNASTNSTIQYKITSNDTLNVQVTSNKACSLNHKIGITAYELPVVNLTPDTSLCISSAIRLEAKTTGTGLQYLWNTQAMTKTLDVSPAYPQTYWVRVNNSNGCKKTDSVYVDVLPLPIIHIVGDTVICRGETFSLTAHGGVSYLWSDGTTMANIQKQPLQNIAYKVTATDENGCVDSKSVQVIVNALPNVSISGTTSLCSGDTSTITASGGINYQWSNGDIFSSTFINPSKSDTLKVVVTNAENCSITKEIPITVFPLPEIVILGDTGVCQGKSFSISASAPGFILTSYKWNTGTTTSGLTYLPNYSDYYVVTVEDSRGCTNQQQHLVTVYELPEVWITGISSICPGEEIQLQANGNAAQYIWNTGVGGTVLTDYPQSNKIYTLKGISVYGCESPLQVFDVTIYPFPKATIEATPLRISKKNSAVFFNANLNNREQALWDLGDGSQSMQGEFSHTYTVIDGIDTFYVALVVTTQYGCKDTAYQIIRIEQHIPNTFTPNGDGFNDFFLEDCKCSNIQIFDRLGIKMYDGQGPWNGKYKGSIVANDTYFYIITYSNGDIQKGYISVVGSKK